MTAVIHSLPFRLLPTIPGAGSSTGLESLYDVAIGGRGYMLDWTDESRTPYSWTSSPLLRDQADSGSTVGEQSINPEGPWRRTIDSWHAGAGQANFDRADSNTAQFNTSIGVDVWTKSQVSLLNEAAGSLSTSSTNLFLAVAGSRLYVADGQTLKYTTNPYAASPSYTTVTGTPAATITDLCSDGYQVYAAYGASGIYETDTSTGAAAQWTNTTAVDKVAWVRGRFMASSGASIYNVTKAVGSAAADLPSALFTHRNADFEWVGFADSGTQIYAAGFSGDKSEIYRIGIVDTAASLDEPVPAAHLPDGEIVSAIYGYLGFVLIGTTKGVRFATPDAEGNLILGALIDIGETVRCFEGQGRFVWFGWENQQSLAAASGLGRIDLSTFSDGDRLTPAYASDLLPYAGTGNVTSVATFDGKRVFSIAGAAVAAESTDLTAFGVLTTGQITYGISEQKTAFDVLLTADFSGGGSISVDIAADEDDFSTIGSASSTGTSRMLADEARGNRYEVKMTFLRNSSSQSQGPVLVSSTLRSYPRVETTNYITASLLLQPVVRGRNDSILTYDTAKVRADIDALRRTQTITTFQEGNFSWPVLIDTVQYRALPGPKGSQDARGVLDVRMKVVA